MIHICTPWNCGYGTTIWRINVNTRWFHLGIALSPGSKFVARLNTDQLRRWTTRRSDQEAIDILTELKAHWVEFDRN